jgi:hypothetical protein
VSVEKAPYNLVPEDYDTEKLSGTRPESSHSEKQTITPTTNLNSLSSKENSKNSNNSNSSTSNPIVGPFMMKNDSDDVLEYKDEL